MKNMLNTIKAVLSEASDKPTVRLTSDGRMRIQLDRQTAERNRGVVRHHGELKVGDHVRKGGSFDRTAIVTKITPKAEPDKRGNTHDVEIQSVGRLFSNPMVRNNTGQSQLRTDGTTYIPPKRATHSRTISMKKHPKYGWIEGRGLSDPGAGHRDPDSDPQHRVYVAVKPKK